MTGSSATLALFLTRVSRQRLKSPSARMLAHLVCLIGYFFAYSAEAVNAASDVERKLDTSIVAGIVQAVQSIPIAQKAQTVQAVGKVNLAGTSSIPAEEVTGVKVKTSDREFTWRPLLAILLGIGVVLLLMIGLKFHAFVALILGSLAISACIPLEVTGFNRNVKGSGAKPHVVVGDSQPANVVSRVTTSLGNAVVGIGVLIAMASIVGKCMLVSGAADRIVQTSLAWFGEKRAAVALMASGFVLGIPVFFDTVFYLLVPLARSLYRRTGKNYLLYLCAIAGGGAVTHTLVPPTPGPLLVVEALKVDIGIVILIGLAVGAPTSLVGLLMSHWLNRRMPIAMRPITSSSTDEDQPLEKLPELWMALIPVLLPVMLISVSTIYRTWIGDSTTESNQVILDWMKLLGDANLAMILAALFSIFLCWKIQGHNLRKLADHVEDALLSGGVIILITAAGGAFGNLLAMTDIQKVFESLFGTDQQQVSGLWLMCIAFVLAALLKIAQGSSTVSMIVTSSLVAPLAINLDADKQLGIHIAYFVPIIGSGSLMGSWMNDSGFWIFAKMGVLNEAETLKSWTVLLMLLSITGFAFSVTLAYLLPLV